MEKLCRKYAPKLVPEPFLILVNKQKQPLPARNSFKYLKRIIKKPEKVNFIFSLEPSPF